MVSTLFTILAAPVQVRSQTISGRLSEQTGLDIMPTYLLLDKKP